MVCRVSNAAVIGVTMSDDRSHTPSSPPSPHIPQKCGIIAPSYARCRPTMKLTTLAHTVLAVVAIAIAAASSPTPDLGTQLLDPISPATNPTTLAKRPSPHTP